jgi:hypothetical protein
MAASDYSAGLRGFGSLLIAFQQRKWQQEDDEKAAYRDQELWEQKQRILQRAQQENEMLEIAATEHVDLGNGLIGVRAVRRNGEALPVIALGAYESERIRSGVTAEQNKNKLVEEQLSGAQYENSKEVRDAALARERAAATSSLAQAGAAGAQGRAADANANIDIWRLDQLKAGGPDPLGSGESAIPAAHYRERIAKEAAAQEAEIAETYGTFLASDPDEKARFEHAASLKDPEARLDALRSRRTIIRRKEEERRAAGRNRGSLPVGD